MTKIKEVISILEDFAPKQYQESYDNCGLLVGDSSQEVTGVLVSLDCTEAIIEEAILKKCNLIVSHHPLVFKGLKKLTGSNYVERTLLKAIKNDIALYAIHTNLDNVSNGVNFKIAEKLLLNNVKILVPKSNLLLKLVTFVPQSHLEIVMNALHNAGAGQIGNYKDCSFYVKGTGTFTPGNNSNPFSGQKQIRSHEEEIRLEVILPSDKETKILQALKKAHPYEEVAYYLHELKNENQEVGSGVIGKLLDAMPLTDFLKYLKDKMALSCIRYTAETGKMIKTVAVCGGSGSFLLFNAKAQNADIFITADFKYHEFFDAENQIVIADIGHYESEFYTKELICEVISKKIVNIAVILSETNTNPINYF